MKLFLLIALQVLFGWGLLGYLSLSAKVFSKVGLSYLMGLFATSFIVYAYEFLGITLTYNTIIIGQLLCALGVNLRLQVFIKSVKDVFDLKSYNFSLFDLVAVAICWRFLYFSIWRSFHMPVVPFDALVGIDLLAKYAVLEGHVVSSVFTKPDIAKLLSTQPFYAPLTSFNQIAYRFTEAVYGQVWIPLAFLSFCAFAYERIKSSTNSIIAGLVLLLTFFATELYSYTYLLQTDLINAIFFSIGVIFLLDYIKDMSAKSMFWLSSVFFAVAVWARIETVIIVSFLSLFIVFENFKIKQYTNMITKSLLFMCLPVLSNVLWNVLFYNFVFPFHPSTKGEIIFGGKYSAQFTSDILSQMSFYLFHTSYWGYILYVFLLIAICNLVVFRNKTTVYTLLIFVFINLAFFLMLHHFDKIIVSATYRRGIFKVILSVALLFSELDLLKIIGKKINSWLVKVA